MATDQFLWRTLSTVSQRIGFSFCPTWQHCHRQKFYETRFHGPSYRTRNQDVAMYCYHTETGTSGPVIKEGRLRWNYRVKRKDGADWVRRDTKMKV